MAPRLRASVQCQTCATAAVLLALSCTTGCRTPAERHASFALLPPPPRPTASPQDGGHAEPSDTKIVAIEPYARGTLAPPAYPTSALLAPAGRRTVFVTFTVDESGATTDVHRSLARVELPDRYSAAFDAAAIAAVRQWQFEPARLVYWRRVPAKDDQYVGTETISATFEVQFTFESGRGQ